MNLKCWWHDGDNITYKSPNGKIGTKEECEVFEKDLKEIKVSCE